LRLLDLLSGVRLNVKVSLRALELVNRVSQDKDPGDH